MRRNTSRNISLGLAGLLALSLSCCSKKRIINNNTTMNPAPNPNNPNAPANNSPPIITLPNYEVDEGSTLTIDLNSRITDPEGDQFTVRLESGPGQVNQTGISRFEYVYQDPVDENLTNNEHEIVIKAQDVYGAETGSSFRIRQIDRLPTVLQTQPFQLSSSLESRILEDWGETFQSNRAPQLSIAINNQGEPTLIYQDSSPERNFSSASLVGGNWIRKPIASEGIYTTAGYGQNKPQVVFNSTTPGEELVHATFAENQWTKHIVDNTPNSGRDNDFVVDAQGNKHITYTSSGRLKYASNSSGQWTIEDLTGSAEGQTSIALDSNNQPHVVHVAQGGTSVNYLTKQLGVWNQEPVHWGKSPIIRKDSQGTMRLVFQGQTMPPLYFGTRVGSTWNLQSVYPQTHLSEDNRLSFETDSNNKSVICYTPANRVGLRVMTNHAGYWREHQIDNGEWTNPKLAIDPQNRIHIIGAREGKVHYLTFDPSQLP